MARAQGAVEHHGQPQPAGAVINLSVLFIIGDRLERNGTLERRQVLVLSRIFCAAAFWSPFFVAMAVALTYAPGLQLSRILPFGVVATLLAMGLTAWQVERLGWRTLPAIRCGCRLWDCRWHWPCWCC